MGRADAGIPEHVVAVARAGEASGTLAQGLLRVGASVRRADALKKKVRTALIYPACVCAAVGAAILVLVGVVVPTLETMLTDGAHHLPWQTRLLVAAGRFLRNHAMALAVGSAALVVVSFFLVRTERVRVLIEAALLRTPILGTVLSAAETARIAGMLAMLSAAGLQAVNAIALARSSAQLVSTRKAFSLAITKVREGSRLYESLGEVRVLGPRALALIRIGETTGRLGLLLDETAREADEVVSTAIDRFLALLTPVMTLFFGAIAGFVLYAVMTSILSVNNLATLSR
jgi:general secretion pathway protein F